MSVGMMSGAYFVGRKQLLAWLNASLSLNYTKVEQCASGVVAAQVIDAMYPGKVNVKMMDWHATQEWQFVKNWKVVQQAFKRLNIDKYIDVSILVKAKYQDNLEFLQWLKAHFDAHAAPDVFDTYDAVARRGGASGTRSTASSRRTTSAHAGRTTSSTSSSRRTTNAPSSTSSRRSPTTSSRSTASSSRYGHTSGTGRRSTMANTSSSNATTSSSSSSRQRRTPNTSTPNRTSSSSQQQQQQLQQLQRENAQLREALTAAKAKADTAARSQAELSLDVGRLERERDFYFGKLREVELYCQTHATPEHAIVQDVQGILYAEDEDDGEDGWDDGAFGDTA